MPVKLYPTYLSAVLGIVTFSEEDTIVNLCCCYMTFFLTGKFRTLHWGCLLCIHFCCLCKDGFPVAFTNSSSLRT